MMNLPFAALLLAGGRSQRMGHDKALLRWQGRPLWSVQLEKLQALDPQRLLIACREEQGLHRQPTHESQVDWLFDPPSDELGPLGAILRALRRVEMPLLVLAVDLPQMTTEFLRDQVLVHLSGDLGFFFESPHGIEPMAALYVPAMKTIFDKALTEHRLSLQKGIRQTLEAGLAQVQYVSPQQERFFVNTNTPEEWAYEKGRSE